MIQVLKTGITGKLMVYLTSDEKETHRQLFSIRESDGAYYQNGARIASHWILDRETLSKLKLHTK